MNCKELKDKVVRFFILLKKYYNEHEYDYLTDLEYLELLDLKKELEELE